MIKQPETDRVVFPICFSLLWIKPSHAALLPRNHWNGATWLRNSYWSSAEDTWIMGMVKVGWIFKSHGFMENLDLHGLVNYLYWYTCMYVVYLYTCIILAVAIEGLGRNPWWWRASNPGKEGEPKVYSSKAALQEDLKIVWIIDWFVFHRHVDMLPQNLSAMIVGDLWPRRGVFLIYHWSSCELNMCRLKREVS